MTSPPHETSKKIAYNTPLQLGNIDEDKDEKSHQEEDLASSPEKESRPSFQEALFEKTEDFEDEDEEHITEFHLCQCCYDLNPWLSFALYAFCGSALLLTPFIIGVTHGQINPATLFYVEPGNNALSPPDTNGFPISPMSQVFYFPRFVY